MIVCVGAEKEKLEKMSLPKKVAMKALTPSVVSVKRIVVFLEMETSPLMKANEELLSCSWRTTFSAN